MLEEQSRGQNQPRVVVIDDNPVILDVLKKVLEKEGCDVSIFENPNRALEHIGKESTDLIICDVMMPDLDGYGVQNVLHTEPETRQIPFIFLTARSSKECIQKGSASGADSYLTKPFDPEHLVAVVKGKLSKAELLRGTQHALIEKLHEEIIHQISHEFRTPLVAVNTGSEFLSQEAENISKEAMKSLIESIRSGGQRIEKLVNDFTLLQNLNRGILQQEYTDQKEKLDLVAEIKEFISNSEDVEKNVQAICFEEPDQHVSVLACKKHLQIVFQKLLDNAIKFSGDHLLIEIAFEVNPDSYVMRLKDQGKGFDEEDIDKLSAHFYQENRKKYEQQGVGLGLSIVHRILRLADAKLQVQNHENGAEVAIEFPLNVTSQD